MNLESITPIYGQATRCFWQHLGFRISGGSIEQLPDGWRIENMSKDEASLAWASNVPDQVLLDDKNNCRGMLSEKWMHLVARFEAAVIVDGLHTEANIFLFDFSKGKDALKTPMRTSFPINDDLDPQEKVQSAMKQAFYSSDSPAAYWNREVSRKITRFFENCHLAFSL